MRTEWDGNSEVLKQWKDKKKEYATELVKLGYGVLWSYSGEPWITVRLQDIDDEHTLIQIQCKCFLNPSTFGINDGRISKMDIRTYQDYPYKQNLELLYNFDRGFDFDKIKESEFRALVQTMFDDVIRIIN